MENETDNSNIGINNPVFDSNVYKKLETAFIKSFHGDPPIEPLESNINIK